MRMPIGGSRWTALILLSTVTFMASAHMTPADRHPAFRGECRHLDSPSGETLIDIRRTAQVMQIPPWEAHCDKSSSDSS